VATVNRNLVTIRRFFGWLAEHGHVGANPAKPVKELKRTVLASPLSLAQENHDALAASGEGVSPR
jgi:integrase/recombinase XerC